MKKLFFLLLVIHISLYAQAQWISIPRPEGTPIYKVSTYQNEIFISDSDTNLYRTSDSGKNWIKVNTGLKFKTSITELYKIGDDKFYALNSQGYFLFAKSNFSNWSLHKLPDPYYYETSCFYSIGAVSYIVSTRNNNNAIFKSNDLGETWTKSSQIYIGNILSISSINNKMIIGTTSGCFITNDEGKTLDTIQALKGHVINVLQRSGTLIYAGTNQGVFVSPDEGLNWRNIRVGLKSLEVNMLKVKDEVLYAGTTRGIFKLNEDQNAWIDLNTGLDYRNITSLAFTDSLLLIGYTGGEGIYSLGLKSDIVSWNKLYSGRPEPLTVLSLEATNEFKIGSTAKGLYRILKNDTHWNKISDGFISSAPQQTSLKTCFDSLWAYSVGRLYVSTDTGANWKQVYPEVIRILFGRNGIYGYNGMATVRKIENTGFVEFNWGMLYSRQITDLNVSENIVLYYGYDRHDGNEYQLSVDRAKTSKSLNSIPGYNTLGSLNNWPVLGTNSGILFTEDQGLSWKSANDGLDSLRIKTLYPAKNCLFAVTPLGIFVTKDLQKWTSLNEGLSGTDVLAFASNDSAVYVSTSAGLYQLSFKFLDENIINAVSHKKESDLFLQTYPNPATSVFNLSIQLPLNEEVKIEIKNLLGQVVYKEYLVSNDHVFRKEIDLSDCTKGMYLLNVETNQRKLTKKIYLIN